MEVSLGITIIGILGSVTGWIYNEIQKRKLKLLLEKEKRYENIIRLLRNLGEAGANSDKGNEFIVEIQLCWMYCPDEVIKKGNQFLDSMNPKIGEKSQEDIDRIKGEFILELRKDLIKMNKSIFRFLLNNTKLDSQDFRDVVFSLKTEK